MTIDPTIIPWIPAGATASNVTTLGTNGLLIAGIGSIRNDLTSTYITAFSYQNTGVPYRNNPTTITLSYTPASGALVPLLTWKHPDDGFPRTYADPFTVTMGANNLMFITFSQPYPKSPQVNTGATNSTTLTTVGSLLVSATAPTATSANLSVWGFYQ